jgi:hypothetical protein
VDEKCETKKRPEVILQKISQARQGRMVTRAPYLLRQKCQQ